jgi:hypothetical protein
VIWIVEGMKKPLPDKLMVDRLTMTSNVTLARRRGWLSELNPRAKV